MLGYKENIIVDMFEDVIGGRWKDTLPLTTTHLVVEVLLDWREELHAIRIVVKTN